MENIVIVVMVGSAISLVPIVADLGYNLIGYTDDYGDKNVEGVKHLGANDALPEIKEKYNCYNAVIGVGGIGNMSSVELRKELYAKIKAAGFNLPPIISKRAYVSPLDVEIGEGSILMPGAIVQTGARIGKCNLLNTGAQVDHECRLGDFVHIAPGAVLCGRVNVEDDAHIGANSVVRESLTVGEKSVVGAGAVVVKNLEKEKIYIGNPAKELIGKK